MSGYSRLPVHGTRQITEYSDAMYHGNLHNSDNIPLKSNVTSNWRQGSASETYYESQTPFPNRPTVGRTDTGSSIKAASPWEHKLNEKHLKGVPASSDTVRHFDRGRQTRRVFLDCLLMWSGTALICGAIAGSMYGFSRIQDGMTQFQKYGYNAIITGLSILLGLAFAAQFKQYAEMMRWRFLASQYRTLEDFELVLGCDSYRNTLSLVFGGGRTFTKTRIIAILWFLIFVIFNVIAALIGLTYSIDVSEDVFSMHYGPVSVLDLSYWSNVVLPDGGEAYSPEYQKAAVNLFGEVGEGSGNVFQSESRDSWYYALRDTSPDNDGKQSRQTTRQIHSMAECEELNVTFGGQAGFDLAPDSDLRDSVGYLDANGDEQVVSVPNAATGATTWMGNSTSMDIQSCGPRCVQLLALQTANNCTDAQILPGGSCEGSKAVPVPRLWTCRNTISEVTNVDSAREGFEDPSRLVLPDLQAQMLAGGIGWSGVVTVEEDLQYVMFRGDTNLDAQGNVTAQGMADLVMSFSVGAVFAYDVFGGARINVTGANSPGPAQLLKVKWTYASAILFGLPFVQFVMLVGVVWFSGKAIIIEPSYLAIGHILQRVLNRVGEAGPLLSVDEMSEKLGDYKIAYGVRPHPNDPGHSVTTFVRDLDVIEEAEGHGYIRGKMPEGRYD